ncbi:MAG: RDD family protein [Actinobacteria bacterium]|nr:RDD family protein [Actinomycetota bacterium]
MFYEDRISVATPEGVTLEVSLAGVGSRFVAALLDQLIRLAVLGALFLGLALLRPVAEVSWGGVVAVLLVAVFVVQFGYDVAFETLASGRTPGKRWTGLRVVKMGGAPVGFLSSALRNLLRLVDYLPGFYLVGILAVLFTKNNQRLGDLAAGTIVVRERRRPASPLPPAHSPAAPGPSTADSGLWDVSAITSEEVATVRRFLDRRTSLAPDARQRLALDMATRLGPKVVGPPREWQAESFLEYLVEAKGGRA